MSYLHDWFKELLKANETAKNEKVDAVFFAAVPTPVVELIFLKCCHFRQCDEVRYLSVELFERFIREHFLDLLNKILISNPDSVRDQWKLVEKKIKIQTSLRMFSCIQIASKFINQPNILRPKEIQKFLRAEGKSYTLSSIMASEMRVWRTLKFKINVPTVLTFVDLILEELKCLPQFSLPNYDIHQVAILLIDTTYLHHQEIYRKLFYVSTGRWEPTNKEKLEILPVERNHLYRAAAIVALSKTFAANDFDNSVYQQLSVLTDISVEDIQALVTILKQIVFS